MTEVTPVSSVERKVIGLATAPPAVAVAVSVAAVEVDAAEAVEDLAESATIVTNLVTFRETVPKKDKKEEEEEDSADEVDSAVVADVAAAAAAVECATTASNPAIWRATVPRSALNAHGVVVSVADSVVAVASVVVVAEVVVAAAIVNATSAKAMATSRWIAPMSRRLVQSGARYLHRAWNKIRRIVWMTKEKKSNGKKKKKL